MKQMVIKKVKKLIYCMKGGQLIMAKIMLVKTSLENASQRTIRYLI